MEPRRAARHGEPHTHAPNRTEYPKAQRADDFEQAGLLYRVMTEEERSRLVGNIAGHLRQAGREIQQRQVEHFRRADADYGARVARALELA